MGQKRAPKKPCKRKNRLKAVVPQGFLFDPQPVSLQQPKKGLHLFGFFVFFSRENQPNTYQNHPKPYKTLQNQRALFFLTQTTTSLKGFLRVTGVTQSPIATTSSPTCASSTWSLLPSAALNLAASVTFRCSSSFLGQAKRKRMAVCGRSSFGL